MSAELVRLVGGFQVSQAIHAVAGRCERRRRGEHALNVNRRGVVFVQANEARLDALVERVAECSLDLCEELLEHE